MGDACPQPDTRNRYEGRGSGDRIARLKAIATRAGPAPTVQNSASWNLTNQQGCCDTCNITCFVRDIEILGPEEVINVDTYYRIVGVQEGSDIVFNIAQATSYCVQDPGCNMILTFLYDNVYPSGVSVNVDGTSQCLVPISLKITDTSADILTDNISVSSGYNACGSGVGGDRTVKLHLVYPGP